MGGTQKSTVTEINRDVRHEGITPGGLLGGGVGSLLIVGEVSQAGCDGAVARGGGVGSRGFVKAWGALGFPHPC